MPPISAHTRTTFARKLNNLKWTQNAIKTLTPTYLKTSNIGDYIYRHRKNIFDALYNLWVEEEYVISPALKDKIKELIYGQPPKETNMLLMHNMDTYDSGQPNRDTNNHTVSGNTKT